MTSEDIKHQLIIIIIMRDEVWWYMWNSDRKLETVKKYKCDKLCWSYFSKIWNRMTASVLFFWKAVYLCLKTTSGIAEKINMSDLSIWIFMIKKEWTERHSVTLSQRHSHLDVLTTLCCSYRGSFVFWNKAICHIFTNMNAFFFFGGGGGGPWNCSHDLSKEESFQLNT